MTDQRTVLITAGAGGIGAVMADRFLSAGYQVHICDIDGSALAEFEATHPDVGISRTDVADASQVNVLFKDMEARYGRLDVLINNGGIAGPTAPVEAISDEDWRRTLAVDLDGPFFCSRAAVPLLRLAENGNIINMASNAGLFGFPYRLPYAVSKWGLIGMTKTLAMELGPKGIRVNAICPGSVSGPRIDGVIQRDAQRQGVSEETVRQQYTRQTSLRRFTEPEEVAALALFLASSEAACISGQAVGVDGHTEGLSTLED